MSDSDDEQSFIGCSTFDDFVNGYDPEIPIGFVPLASQGSRGLSNDLGSFSFNPNTGQVEMRGLSGAVASGFAIAGLLAGLAGGSDSSENRRLRQEYESKAREDAEKLDKEAEKRREADKRASEAQAEMEAAVNRLRLEEELRRLGVPPNREVTDEEIRISRSKLGYSHNMVNIGVVGRQNEGKSTLVNSFRGLAHNLDNSAKIGETETTSEPRPYVDNKHVGVVWHDNPGGGTTQTTAWGYYFEQSLFAYDKLVLAHTSTLSEMDIQILQICKYRKQECIVVRTKADQHIRNRNRRCRHASVETSREDFIREVREDTATKNQAAGEVRELCPEYTDYIVSEMCIAQLVNGEAPSQDPFERVIDEEQLLKRLHLLP